MYHIEISNKKKKKKSKENSDVNQLKIKQYNDKNEK
jgi:hypothetical protein